MHGKTRNALLGYGLDSELIDKIASFGHTIELLRAFSKRELRKLYSEEETDKIKSRIHRLPIPDDIIQTVLSKSGAACCYCNDGNSSRPYQIHHVAPYSETQDNTEENLLLVCPTHHSAIHANNIIHSEQKIARRCWYATMVIASDYAAKGISFPFGAFQPLDYKSSPKPAELVEFGPLSPSTSLICYPDELAKLAMLRLKESSFLLVLGGSGSGKSTYATALGGLLTKEDFRIFRHRFDKHSSDALKQVSLFISTCVRNAVVITAYCRLDSHRGLVLANEMNIQPEKIKDSIDRTFIEEARQKYRDLDATGKDYEIKLGDEQTAQEVANKSEKETLTE